MSSSGKGQSTVRHSDDVATAWSYAMEGSRGDLREVIVEQFIPFESEITLLTVTQIDGPTLFCPPIGHRQERGDYQESWMPHAVSPALLAEAQDMARVVTAALGGPGIWGVEFFLTNTEVYFSELSPRPHDTGMVTLGGTITFNYTTSSISGGQPQFQNNLRNCLNYQNQSKIIIDHKTPLFL